MRKTLGVCLLVLLLTGTAGAGIIPNESPAAPQPPQPTGVAQEPDADQGGLMPNEAPSSLMQTVLDLLALLPSLL